MLTLGRVGRIVGVAMAVFFLSTSASAERLLYCSPSGNTYIYEQLYTLNEDGEYVKDGFLQVGRGGHCAGGPWVVELSIAGVRRPSKVLTTEPMWRMRVPQDEDGSKVGEDPAVRNPASQVLDILRGMITASEEAEARMALKELIGKGKLEKVSVDPAELPASVGEALVTPPQY